MRGLKSSVARALLVTLLGCGGCSSDYTWLPEPTVAAGGVQVGLSKAGEIEVDSVWVVLTAPDESTSAYEIDITGSDAASISLGGLSPGQYSVLFSATTREGGSCEGSAEFVIEPDVDTRVHVDIVCEPG